MKNISIKKSNGLNGEITVPGDKSITHRSVIFGALSNGTMRVKGYLTGEDNVRTIDAFRSMGVDIKESGDELLIKGVGLNGLKKPTETIYAGNSGTTARLLLGLLAGQSFSSTITGDEYLVKRPMARVTKPLSLFGANFTMNSDADVLPITVTPGKIIPIDYDMNIASAQVKSALTLAGMYADGVNTITEPTLSRDHTENMLRAMGVSLESKDCRVTFKGGQELSAIDVTVPGDISSAAFFIVAALIIKGSSLVIKGVGVNPTRTGILDVLISMGGDITLENKRSLAGEDVADIVVKHSDLKGIDIRGDVIPRAIDEFPIIALCAAMAEGTTTVRDAKELRVKESDRIATTAENLRKLGVTVTEYPDGMDIVGGASLRGATDLKSYGDHRIAMMLSIAALACDAESTINDIDCVNTSFPNFYALLASINK
ncbi:3-phosphoshikimate 1-carboxyvinyltransferase [Thermodesulfobacteriota bacterium]